MITGALCPKAAPASHHHLHWVPCPIRNTARDKVQDFPDMESSGAGKEVEELKAAIWKRSPPNVAVCCLLKLWQVKFEAVWLSKYCLILLLFIILSSMQLVSREKGIIPRSYTSEWPRAS